MASRPNVLFLLTDQERADLVGPDSLPVDTPNVDRLREEGMWFDAAYTPTSICTSARASLLTGLYPHAHGLLNNSHEADAIRSDLPDLPTLGELLADNGYTNTYIGKWHVSHERGPGDFGFRYFGGSDHHHDNFEVAFEQYRESNDVIVPEEAVEDKIYAGEGENRTLIAGTDPVAVESSRPYFLAELTIDALERWVDGDRDGPFFHRTDFLGPHHPYIVPEPYASMYDPSEIEPWGNYAETFDGKPRVHEQYLSYRGVADFDWDTWSRAVAKYFGFMTLIDDQIGRILQALDEFGMSDDTAVVHTSDHGDLTGSHRLFNKGPMMYDETYRIPLIVRWPDVVEAGSRSEQFVRFHDLMPTVLEWADIEPPNDLHARSIHPLLVGETPDDWPASTYAQYHGDEFGLYSQRMVRTAQYKFIYNGPDRNELYDLAADPHELQNLIAHPEYTDVRREMAQRLTAWMDRVDDSLRGWVPKTLG